MEIDPELTTQEAADVLNVSLPHLVGLLDGGTLPHIVAGDERRIRRSDLLAFKRELEEKRHAALDELAALSQELDMGY